MLNAHYAILNDLTYLKLAQTNLTNHNKAIFNQSILLVDFLAPLLSLVLTLTKAVKIVRLGFGVAYFQLKSTTNNEFLFVSIIKCYKCSV